MSTRTHNTLLIQSAIKEKSKSLTSIAREFGVSRQRVHSIKVRLCQQVGGVASDTIPSRLQNTMVSLVHKPVANRLSRPAWAMNDAKLMEKCVGKAAMKRFKIAQMYWRNNMSAADIATVLEVSVDSVKHVLKRLRKEG